MVVKSLAEQMYLLQNDILAVTNAVPSTTRRCTDCNWNCAAVNHKEFTTLVEEKGNEPLSQLNKKFETINIQNAKQTINGISNVVKSDEIMMPKNS